MNNVCKKQIDDFHINIDNEEILSVLLSKIRTMLKDELLDDFNNERLYIVSDDGIVNYSSESFQSEVSGKSEITIYYSEVVALNNANKVDYCYAKDDSKIEFYIYSRELNHRCSPHTQAVYKKQEMDITIGDEPRILHSEFSGNNSRKNEKIALEYVKSKKDFFLQKWNEIVESQF